MAVIGVQKETYAPNLLDSVGGNKDLTVSDIADKGIYMPYPETPDESKKEVSLDVARRNVERRLIEREKQKKETPLVGRTSEQREYLRKEGKLPESTIAEASKRGVQNSLDGIGMAFVALTPEIDKTEAIKITKSQLAKKQKLKQLYGEGWDSLLSPEMWAETLSNQLVPMGGATIAGTATGLTPAAPVAPAVALSTGTALYTMQGFGSTFLDTFAQAKAENKSDEEAYDIALKVGMAGGGLEGVTGLLPVLGKFGRTMIARLGKEAGEEVAKKSVPKVIQQWDKLTNTTGKRLALSAGLEGIQEASQDVLVDVAKDVEGLAVDYNLEKYAKSGVVGVGVGAGIGGAQELIFSDGQQATESGQEAVKEPTSPTLEPVGEVAQQPEAQPQATPEIASLKGEVPSEKPVEQLYKPEANKRKPADYVIYSEQELSDKEKAYIASNSDGTVQFALSGEEVPSKAGQRSLLLKYDEKANKWNYQDLGEAPSAEGLTVEPQKAEQAPVQPVAEQPKPVEPVQAVEPVQETVQPVVEQKPIEQPVQEVKPTETASVPLMVTRDMKQQLSDLGYSKTDISKLNPSEAWKIIQDKSKPVETPEISQEPVSKPEPIQEPTKKAETIPSEEIQPQVEQIKQQAEKSLKTAEIATKANTLEEIEQKLKPKETPQEAPEPTENDLKDEESTSRWIGITKEELKKVGNIMGFPPLEKGTRKSDAVTIRNAKDKGYDVSAPYNAKEVIDGRKTLDDEETVGMGIAYARILSAYDNVKELKDKAEKSGDIGAYNRHQEQEDNLYDQILEFEEAFDKTGSQSGRNLRSLQFVFDKKEMSAQYIMHQLRKRRKGRKPANAKEEAKLEQEKKEVKDITDKYEAEKKRVEELENQVREQAKQLEEKQSNKVFSELKQEAIKNRRSLKVKTLQERNEQIKKQLIAMGYRANDVTSSIAGGFEAARLLSELAYNNIKIAIANNEAISLDGIVTKVQDFFADVKDKIPSRSDILKAIGMKEASVRAKAVENARNVERKLARQAKLEAELDNAMKGIFKKREYNKKAKEEGKPEKKIYDEEIKAIQIKINQLRNEYSQNIKDDNTMARIEEKIQEAQDMLDKDITKYPETKEGRKEREDIKKGKEELRELRNIINARQSAKELQEEIDNFKGKPLPVEKPNESEALKNARKIRDLKRRELQTMRSLANSLDILENDIRTGLRTPSSKSDKITSDAIENMRKKAKELSDIRKERDKLASEPQKKLERERRENARRLANAKDRLAKAKEILATGNKINKKAKLINETDEEKQIKQEYRSIMAEINKQERIKTLQDKIAYAEEVGLPKGKEKRVEDPEIAKLKKEYSSLLSSLRKEEKAMTEPSPEEKYQEQQDKKLERYNEMADAVKRGVEIAKRKRTENRVDVKMAYAKYLEAKNIANIDKSIKTLPEQIKKAVETNDISELMQYAPKEKPPVNKELAMGRKKMRDYRNRIREILQAAEEEDTNFALRWWYYAWESVRSLNLAYDVGWWLRQGSAYASPFYWKAFKKLPIASHTTFINKEIADLTMADIKKHPNYEDAKYYGFDMPDTDAELTKNELNVSLRGLDRMPSFIKDTFIGKGIRGFFDASSRSPTIAANILRLELWNQFTENNPNAPDEVKRAYTNIHNIFSGRGNLGTFESSVRTLNKYVFLTTRFLASKLQTASVLYPYSKAYKVYKNTGDATILKEVTKLYLGHITTTLGLLALADLMGFDVEWDDDEADFLKVRIWDDTRIPAPSFIIPVWLLAYRTLKRLSDNKPKSRNDILDEAEFFLRKSTNPAVQKPYELVYKKDIFGNKLTYSDIALSLVSPLTIQAATDTLEVEKDPFKALISGLLSFEGLSPQSYESKTEQPTMMKLRLNR